MAATVNVPGDYPTIQAGIDAATYGDTVNVAPGCYTENILLKSGVVVQGAGSAASTIDGRGSGPVVTARYCADGTAIDGFTITGGSTPVYGQGGGIYCEAGAVVISHNRIVENGSPAGGGIGARSQARVAIVANTISQNVGLYQGGGVFGDAGSILTITENTLVGNQVPSGGGGAIAAHGGSSGSISRNTISDNEAPIGSGGGIYLFECSMDISGNSLSGNRASYGGGIFVERSPAASISKNRILSNSASNGGGIGCYGGSHPAIVNNVIAANSADRGGGVWCYLGSSPTIALDTIADNVASEAGGGVWCGDGGSSPRIVDCIIWGNSSGLHGCSAEYSDVQGDDGGAGNISADPRFVDPAAADYRLLSGSPCVDAGLNGVADTDIEGNPRPHDGNGDGVAVADMGAYEIPVAPPTNNAPVAEAGPDQTVHTGLSAALDGSNSSDPDGDALTYEWSVLSRPAGSTADVSDPSAVNPSLAPDMAGNYVIQLIVTDEHGATGTDTLTVSTSNAAPVAAAGDDRQLDQVGQTIGLDGTQSYDPDGDPISYQWSFASKPDGSSATLVGADTAWPTFTPDKYGNYEVRLVVSDPWEPSAADTVVLSFENLAPVANAGTSQSLVVGESAVLNGTASADANGDALMYAWSITSAPLGSMAAIEDPSSAVTALAPDVPGTYVIQLVVNDGLLDSEPSTIQLEVVSRQTAAVTAIQDAQEVGTAMAPTSFKNSNMQNALLNKFNAAIGAVAAGDYQAALAQLENDILAKTDGCATIGVPDKNDWIQDPQGQAEFYPQVQAAIARVKALAQQ